MTLDKEDMKQTPKTKKLKRKNEAAKSAQDIVSKKPKSESDGHLEKKRKKKKESKNHSDKESEVIEKMSRIIPKENNNEQLEETVVSERSDKPKKDKKKKHKKRKHTEDVEEDIPNKDKSSSDQDLKKVKDKKREKRQKKKEEKIQEQVKQKQNFENKDSLDSDACKLALEYLRKWKHDKQNWSFQKVRQVWLLQHMYSDNLVSNERFSDLLEYLDGMKGGSRVVTAQQAEAVMEAYEEEEEEGSGTSSESEEEEEEEEKKETKKEVKETKKEKPSEEKYNRARKIVQLLS